MKNNCLLIFVICFLFFIPLATSQENVYYVSTSGKSTNNGLTKKTTWSWEHAVNTASTGDTVYVKQGNYGNLNLVFLRSGVSFIGYKQSPGDIVSSKGSTQTHLEKVDEKEMPLITGVLKGKGVAFNINAPNIILENLQITHINMGIQSTAKASALTLRNIIITELGTDSATRSIKDDAYLGFGMHIRGDHSLIENCLIVNAGAEAISTKGSNQGIARYNYVYSSNTLNPTDYYLILTQGSSNWMVHNHTSHREKGLEHGGHGIDMKGTATHNTITDSKIIGTNLELNFGGVAYNTFQRIEIIGYGRGYSQWHTHIRLENGAHHNTLKDIYIHGGGDFALSFADTNDGYTPNPDTDEVNGADYNTFVNLIVEDYQGFMQTTTGAGGINTASSDGNEFYNCTVNRVGKIGNIRTANTGFKFVNCSFSEMNASKLQGISKGFTSSVTFENCNFYQVNFPLPAGNSITNYNPNYTGGIGVLQYTLQPKSPLLNAGKTTLHYIDYIGKYRSSSEKFAIGAFEF